jgi:ArsR family transcriptional regulator, lead/cadmium/zinc/bismuth-responsive transcriptional repressor
MKCNAYHIFFGNLSNPLKIKIVEALKEKSLSVNEISKKLKEEQSKISHALAPLKHCNIVKVETRGKIHLYSLNKKTIVPILKIIDKHKINFCEGCNRK